jgi:hypothetical protein
VETWATAQPEEALKLQRPHPVHRQAASPETPIILAALTSQLALAGQDAEARATLTQYLALPSTRTRTVARWDYVPDDNPAFAQFHQRFRSRLRKAGMPECRKGERLNKTLFDDGARKAKTDSHLGLAAEVNTIHELDV